MTMRVRTRVVCAGSKETAFPCDVSDLCVVQRSWVRDYDNFLPLLFRFSSKVVFLLEWIYSTISMSSVM